jgi:hypothetical protein
MSPAAFEPALPASERMQAHDVCRAPTGIGWISYKATNLDVNSKVTMQINHFRPELNSSAQRCLTKFYLLGILLLELCISLIYA